MSAVGTWVWVPTTRLARPSHQCPSAIFSEVASACTSTITALAVPPRTAGFSAASIAENGSSNGRFMNAWPSTCATNTRRPPAASKNCAPRPGAARAKFSGRITRGSVSMKASMSRWSNAWSPSVTQSAPASRSVAACAPLSPMPPVAFSPLTTTKSSAQSRRSRGKVSATAARPVRPTTSPRKSSLIRPACSQSPRRHPLSHPASASHPRQSGSAGPASAGTGQPPAVARRARSASGRPSCPPISRSGASSHQSSRSGRRSGLRG